MEDVREKIRQLLDDPVKSSRYTELEQRIITAISELGLEYSGPLVRSKEKCVYCGQGEVDFIVEKGSRRVAFHDTCLASEEFWHVSRLNRMRGKGRNG